MGVEVYGVIGETNGYGDSMDAFRDAHHANSRILINLAMGRKKNHPPVVYDPRHPDNQWPKMLFHPAYGEKVIGVSLVGLAGLARKQAEQENAAAVKDALLSGYRSEPYSKPQVAVLDPATEKAALLAKNQELEGKLVAANDLLKRMDERLTAIEKKKGE